MPFFELDGKAPSDDNPHELPADSETVVGSGSHASWRVAGKDLAARHLRVTVAGDGAATIAPASPQNVVVLNGRQLAPGGTELTSGDVIAAGSGRFIYLAERDSPRPPAPLPPPDVHLVIYNQQKAYLLRKRVVQIGREIGCSIVLKDPTVSRFHADVRSEAGEYVLYSMGSSGTRVNGTSVGTPRMLVEGDRIEIGDVTFTFTKQPLMVNITVAQFADYSEDAASRRNTQLAQRVVAAGAGQFNASDGASAPFILGAGVVMVVVVLYLALK